jgi:hypothetical protein
MQTTKAEMIYEYCKKQGWESFMVGDAHLLDALFEAAGLHVSSPQSARKWQTVLNICEQNTKTKTPLFRKVRVNLHGHGGIAFARRFYVL